MTNRSRVLRNTFFSSVGVYTEYVLGLLTSIIIARHLGPEAFGGYSLLVWLVALGVATTNSGTASAAIKFVAELRGEGRLELIPVLVERLRRAQRLFLLGVLGIGAVVFAFAGQRLAPGMDHWLLAAFLVLGVALRASYMFNIGVAKGFENFRATAIVALVSTPVNLGLVIVAWFFDAPVEGLMLVFVVSGVVFYLVSAAQVAPLVRASTPTRGVMLPPRLLQRVRRHMGWTALTVSVAFLAASEVEILFLNLYADGTAAGQFKVAYQLAIGAAALVPGVFGALLLPMMANALSQGREVAGRRFVASTGYLAMLALPLVAFGAVFSEALIHLMYGDAYAGAGPAFALCLAAASLLVMTQGGSSLLVSADRQRSILVLVVVFASLKVALGAVLVSRYGLAGAVTSYVTVAVVSAAAIMALAIRIIGAQLEWGRMLRIAIAATLAAIVVLPLRDQMPPWAQLVIGGALLGAAYAPLTLLLGCWSRADIEHLQQLHQRFAAGRPQLGRRFLSWVHQRTPEHRLP